MYFEIDNRAKIVQSANRLVGTFKKIQGKNCLNDITTTVSKNEVQNLIYLSLKEGGELSDPISRIIVKECLKSEAISSGSSVLILELLHYYFSKYGDTKTRKDRLESEKRIRKEILESSKIMNTGLRKSSRSDFIKIINSMIMTENLKNVLIDAIDNYKIGQKLEIKKSQTVETYFESRKGNFLPIEVPQVFLKSKNSWLREEVNVILIDGIIEKVSQIHHHLESASKDGEPYIVICRKALQEVRETVDIKFLRSTVDLVMIETDFNSTYHHLFQDMSAIFNCDFVNVQMGDTLSSRIDRFKFRISKVEITSTGINFFHSLDNDLSVQKYVADIRAFLSNSTGLDSESISAIEKSVDFRTKFLQSSTLVINIGKEDLDENCSEISKIDTFIRSIPDINSCGVIDPGCLKRRNGGIIENVFCKNTATVLTQRQIFQSLLSSFNIYKTINRAEKLFTIRK